MSRKPARERLLWPRFVAEFVVIVVGVLLALGVDGWASARSERLLEGEYLQRLMNDVEYDLAEIDFVEAVSDAGRAYADSLLSQSRFSFERDRLVGAVLIASHARAPDLSRNTWRELINSGRIGLLRSAETRAALAQYDRTVSEQEGFWSIAGYGFSNWAEARIPNRVKEVFEVTCGDSPDPTWSRRLIACSFRYW